jgi:succinate dehydrogenase / fumarate reductase cytochrome b subunit
MAIGKRTVVASIFNFLSGGMNTRPHAPHLQIYRLPITAILSITHRIAGLVLSFGMVFWVAFLVVMAMGESEFSRFQSIVQSIPGKILLWGWIYALFFHLCHGIRHLVWDAGYGFERDTLERYAFLELLCSAGLTLGLLMFISLRG